LQTDTKLREEQIEPSRPFSNKNQGLSASAVVLPARLFLGVSFIAAGLDKLTDPEFFDASRPGYIGKQLAGFATGSPVGDFLTSVAVPNATIFGALVLAGELAIGLGTLVGLFSRLAALFGFVLSITLWLTATWQVQPFYLGADLPYAMGWLVLAVAGPHPLFSLDGWLQKRRSARPAATTASANSLSQTASAYEVATTPVSSSTMARRSFIGVAGATLVAGAVTAIAWNNTLAGKNTNSVISTTGGQATNLPTVTPANPTTAVATNVPTVPVTTAGAVSSNTASATTVASITASVTTTAPATNGTVLAALSSIAVGDAKKFVTPDTKEAGILIRQQDGSVKAFSTICTHQGCEVGFSQADKALVCPCHGARYDITTGAATRRPATLPLKSFSVQVDASGNIVYTKA